MTAVDNRGNRSQDIPRRAGELQFRRTSIFQLFGCKNDGAPVTSHIRLVADVFPTSFILVNRIISF